MNGNKIMGIKFVKQTNSRYISSRHYEGYGYHLMVSYDGTETIVTIDVYDPTFGVGITYMNGSFYLSPPKYISLRNLPRLYESLRNAESFCREFTQREAELLQAPSR